MRSFFFQLLLLDLTCCLCWYYCLLMVWTHSAPENDVISDLKTLQVCCFRKRGSGAVVARTQCTDRSSEKLGHKAFMINLVKSLNKPRAVAFDSKQTQLVAMGCDICWAFSLGMLVKSHEKPSFCKWKHCYVSKNTGTLNSCRKIGCSPTVGYQQLFLMSNIDRWYLELHMIF